MFKEIKLTPLVLFIILLLVLVIATAVKNMGLVSEGFNSYLYSADSFTNQKVVAYDNGRNITKLYDDIFYDPRNGNSVVVYGTQYTTSDDMTGDSVSKIDILSRNGDADIPSYAKATNGQKLSQISDESKKTGIDAVDKQWTRKFTNNQLVCVTWGTKTFLYVMDLTKSVISGNTTTGNTTVSYSGSYQPAVSAYYKDSTLTQSSKYITGQADLDAKRTIYLQNTYSYASDGNDDKNVVDDFYDSARGLYQLTKNVRYDVKNGNLLIQTKTGANRQVDVFYRNARHLDILAPDLTLTSTTTTSTEASNKTFSQTSNTPYFMQDKLDNHTIMFWPNDDNSIIIVFANALDADGSVRVVKYRRFLKDRVYTGSANNYGSVSGSGSGSGSGSDISGNSDILNAFARWYIYFNSDSLIDGGLNSSDYLLKTQIVPPVCPACPGCSGSVCTNCGGSGGSGTQTSGQQSLAFDNKTVVGATGNLVNNTIGTAGNVVSSTVGTAGNVVNKTVDVAGNVVNKTLDTATNVVGKTFDTAGNLVGKTFDAAGNLLGSTADRLGLDRVGYSQSYRGPVNNSSSANASGYQSGTSGSEYRPGSNNTGVATLPNASPTDQYSYNGALQPKGANFIPITTDFSRFGR